MRIKTSKLRELLRAERERIQRQVREHNERRRRTFTDERERYVSTTQSAWQAFIASVADALHNGEPVTWDTVPQELRGTTWGGGNNALRFYDDARATRRDAADRDARPEDKESYRKMSALLALLDATDDETISTYSLQKAGFNLELIMRRAAEEKTS